MASYAGSNAQQRTIGKTKIMAQNRPSGTKLKVAQCSDVDPALPKVVSLHQSRKLTKHNT